MKKHYLLCGILAVLLPGGMIYAQCNFKPLGPDEHSILTWNDTYTLASASNASGIYLAFADGANAYRVTVMKYASGTWSTVGTAGFSAGKVGDCKMVLDASGNPYICYVDSANLNKLSVKRFDGTGWVTVGTDGFTGGAAAYPSIALTSTNIPYVSFRDASKSNKLTVMRFLSGAWSAAGTAGFTVNTVKYTSMAIDPATNTPYVSYADASAGNKVSVNRFITSTSAWLPVGGALGTGPASYIKLAVKAGTGLYVAYADSLFGNSLSVKHLVGLSWLTTGYNISAGAARDIDMTFDGLSQPVVSYSDLANGNKVTVQVYDLQQQVWSTMGYAGFSDGAIKQTAVTFDGSNINLAYIDSIHHYKPAVKKYTGNNWVNIASAGGFSSTSSYYLPVVIDKSGTPYAAFMDSMNNNQPVLMKYDGANWIKLGTPNFPSNQVLLGSIDVADDGTLYIAVEDNQNDVTVMKYDGTSWVTVGSPNITGAPATWTTLKLDKTGKPWIAFKRQSLTGYATVMKFNGTTWEVAGNPRATEDDISYLSLVFDSYNTPFLGYVDGSIYGDTYYNYPSVRVLSGYDWNLVGLIDADAQYTTVAVSPEGKLYLAYKDYYSGGRATVMNYDYTSGNWNNTGQPIVSEGRVYALSMNIDSSGTPFVVYTDETYGYRPVMKKYADTGWATVNTPGFSLNELQYDGLSMAIDRTGTPFVAYNDGNSWAKAYDEKIAMANTSKTDTILSSRWKYFKNSCDIIATVNPDGASPISGTTKAKLWIETAPPAGIVKRHYEIVPLNNTTTATATVILYFTQAEFTAYNAANTGDPPLPVGPADITGKANLRILKRNGSSTDSSGSPYTYTGNLSVIDPPDSDIIWNSTQARWEITIHVTGFGGLFVTTHPAVDFNICSSSVHTISTGTIGTTYQWQADTGTGFTNISNGTNYSGVTTNTLSITGLSSTLHHGIQYRCVVNGIPETPYAINFDVRWLGNTDNNWFTGSNWSGCGAVPDSGSFVIITSGRPNNPVPTGNTSIWGLSSEPGSALTIQSGARLTILK